MSKPKQRSLLQRAARPAFTVTALTGSSGAVWLTVFQSLGDPLISGVVTGAGLLAAVPFLSILLESDQHGHHSS